MDTAPAGPVIELLGLTKNYGTTTAVDDLSLTVQAGEVVGLLGPNGAGKTTTILMLLGLTEPTKGSATVMGMDPRRHPLEVKRAVGYLPDAVGFYDDLTGRQNLRFSARLNRLDRGSESDAIDRALERVGLAGAGDKPVGAYSRGMRQRLGIADALLKEPRVLILDEPTVSIDPAGVDEILRLIRTVADESGVTVLLSSHLLNQVQAVCDRVAIFFQGRVLAIGTPDELAARGDTELVSVDVADDADVEAVLGGHARVRGIRRGVGRGSWELDVDRGAVSEAIDAMVGAGVGLRAVRPTGTDLAATYQHYFTEDARV